MASNPRPEPRANGGVVYKIQWREKGKPGRPTKTFYDRESALLFKRLVEVGGRGNDMYPGDEEMIRRGLLTAEDVEAAKPEPEPEPEVVTVEQAMAMFITFKANTIQDRPTDRTLDNYWGLHRNFIVGTALGSCDVATVRAKPILAWVNEQRRRPLRGTSKSRVGLSPVSMNKALALLSSMFKWSTMTISDPSPMGEKPLRVIASPMAEVRHFRISGDPRKEKQVLRKADEYRTLFQCAYDIDPDWADMVLFSALTGARFGEASAITVGQCDPSNYSINLDRRYSAGRPEMGTKGSSSAEAGYVVSREARIPEGAWSIIEARCAGKRPDALVFDGHKFSLTKRWAASTDNRRWIQLGEELAKHGLDRGFRHHHLRHSLTTYLRSVGIDTTIVKGVAGHADPSVTGRYLHMTDETWNLVLNALEPLAAGVTAMRESAYAAFRARLEAATEVA